MNELIFGGFTGLLVGVTHRNRCWSHRKKGCVVVQQPGVEPTVGGWSNGTREEAWVSCQPIHLGDCIVSMVVLCLVGRELGSDCDRGLIPTNIRAT